MSEQLPFRLPGGVASRSTSETVFILGAGASAEAGAPLMDKFLDEAEKLLRSGRAKAYAEQFELVFKGIAALQAVFAKSLVDTRNLESVFSAFEIATLIGSLHDLSADEVSKLVPAMRTVIFHTLEQTVRYPIQGAKVVAPEPYVSFVEDVHKRGVKRTCIVTFNYDLAIDFAFRKYSLHYGLDGRPKPSDALEILKLHGSLNWTRCTKCREVFAWPLSELGSLFPMADQLYTTISVVEHLPAVSHPGCGGHGEKEPIIIAPALSKGDAQSGIGRVWQRAAANLAEAEDILVIGYSFPRNDEFFRYLFALGTIGQVRPKNFIVYNPDERVKTRFEEFLGPVMRQRFDIKPIAFRDAIGSFPPSRD
jgi:hypothetical protein